MFSDNDKSSRWGISKGILSSIQNTMKMNGNQSNKSMDANNSKNNNNNNAWKRSSLPNTYSNNNHPNIIDARTKAAINSNNNLAYGDEIVQCLLAASPGMHSSLSGLDPATLYKRLLMTIYLFDGSTIKNWLNSKNTFNIISFDSEERRSKGSSFIIIDILDGLSKMKDSELIQDKAIIIPFGEIPTLETLMELNLMIYSHLIEDRSNQVLFLGTSFIRGKLSFILASFLLFSGFCKTVDEAIDKTKNRFAIQLLASEKGSLLKQILFEFSKLIEKTRVAGVQTFNLRDPPTIYLDSLLLVNSKFRGSLQAYIYHGSRYEDICSCSAEACENDEKIIKFNASSNVKGDVKIGFFREKLEIFSTWFHTSLISNSSGKYLISIESIHGVFDRTLLQDMKIIVHFQYLCEPDMIDQSTKTISIDLMDNFDTKENNPNSNIVTSKTSQAEFNELYFDDSAKIGKQLIGNYAPNWGRSANTSDGFVNDARFKQFQEFRKEKFPVYLEKIKRAVVSYTDTYLANQDDSQTSSISSNTLNQFTPAHHQRHINGSSNQHIQMEATFDPLSEENIASRRKRQEEKEIVRNSSPLHQEPIASDSDTKGENSDQADPSNNQDFVFSSCNPHEASDFFDELLTSPGASKPSVGHRKSFSPKNFGVFESQDIIPKDQSIYEDLDEEIVSLLRSISEIKGEKAPPIAPEGEFSGEAVSVEKREFARLLEIERDVLKEKNIKPIETKENQTSTISSEPVPQTRREENEIKNSQTSGSINDNDEIIKPYVKMLEMGVPRPAVEQKMKKDNIDPKLLPLVDRKEIKEDQKASAPSTEIITKRVGDDDSKYAVYFKMLKMGIPRAAVEIKMKTQSVNPKILDLNPSDSIKLAEDLDQEYESASKSASLPTKKENETLDAGQKRAKRKTLHWLEPVLDAPSTNQGKSSLWSDVNLISSNELANDEDTQRYLEELFMAKREPIVINKSNNSNNNSSNDKAKLGEEKMEKSAPSILPSRRAQNVEIGLAKLKLSPSVFVNALTQWDTAILTPGIVEIVQCSQLLPTSDESKMLNQHYQRSEETISKKPIADDFLLAVTINVPDADKRIQTLGFYYVFDNLLKELKKNSEIVRLACEEVRESNKLKKLLHVILYIGNQLSKDASEPSNQTNESNSLPLQGFTLKSLSNICHSKSSDGKTTILEKFCVFVNRKFPDIGDVYATELIHLTEAKRFTFPSLFSDLDVLERGLRLSKLLFKDQSQDSASDGYSEVKSFIQIAEGLIHERRVYLEETKEKYIELAQYFGEDGSQDPTEMLNVIDSFMIGFQSHITRLRQLEKRMSMNSLPSVSGQSLARRSSVSISISSNAAYSVSS